MINWNTTPEDDAKLQKLAERAVKAAKSAGFAYKLMDATMDIKACHLNGNPLDLEKLLGADDFNFAHDVFGIRRHLNRTTGELGDFFSPRCSA